MLRSCLCGATVLALTLTSTAALEAQSADHLNPLVSLHIQGKPVFGLYAPRPGGGPGRGGRPPEPVKSPSERASETLSYDKSDYVFDGSMEYGVEKGLPAFKDFVAALRADGATAHDHPLVIKTTMISEDAALATREIGRQLDAGASGIMFVGVESADEVRTGLAAMRYADHGGTRASGDATAAAAYWGLNEAEYRKKADLWPLDPEGELINWTIVESKEGLAHVREIAAVPGIGVLWPGAGTLRGVFTTTDAAGERHFDAEGWENAIQTVLAACKEFNVPCGYPANENDIEMRMKQGFSVFVMGWGDSGFKTVEMGRKLGGR